MKKTALISSVLFTLGTVGVAGPALAESMDNEELFNQLDANGDGVLTEEEVTNYPQIADQFDTLDADGSGDISKEEFQAYQPSGSSSGSDSESSW